MGKRKKTDVGEQQPECRGSHCQYCFSSFLAPAQAAHKQPTGVKAKAESLTCQLYAVIDPRCNCGIQQKAGQAQQKDPYRSTGLGSPHQALPALRRHETFHRVVYNVT